MRTFLKKLKGKFSTKGATSSPVPGASSAEPAPRPSSVESIVTPAPAPAVVAEPEVAAAPSSNAGFSTVWNGVLDVLRIAQASLDSVPVPGLKSAIGGFLEIVHQLDTVGANVDAIHQLEDTVKFFNQSVSKPLEKYGGKPSVPSELSEAIDALSGEFVTAISPLKSYGDKSLGYRWANLQPTAAEVGKAGGRIRDALEAFNVAQGVRHYLQNEQLREGIEEIKAYKRNEASAEEAKQLESLLNRLPHTSKAGYDTNRPGAPSNCFPGTRTKIIKEVNQWLHHSISDTTKPVLWLNGLAGIEDELSNAKRFLGTIVRDFAKKLPKFGAAVAEALKKDDKLYDASLATQYSSLLFTPLKDLKLSEPLFVIIDALDECE
ncbi:uncharacterized protein EI90DRAFT_1676485 [Cantharellus anzutake]|uniref:uncharacterized protein n=1 Tax=Cantharellus anzutake TaxID=1750568 RepID=UPI001902D299|nr:uncharacterized protein EI90DRAFT_1676485 [Cantharellus anzutake]KAF8327712.1 hypothetical protein EI90DRAFT_1676485 [Cantharellus anzutake]